jgi:hypothetical protein
MRVAYEHGVPGPSVPGTFPDVWAPQYRATLYVPPPPPTYSRQIRGDTQIKNETIKNAQISPTAAIALSKLEKLPLHNISADVNAPAKGDILVSDGVTWKRKSAGANTRALIADSSKVDGLDWGGTTLPTTMVKGDVLVSDGTTWKRKAVGADGTALKSDSTNADGVSWGTVASSGGGGGSGGSMIFISEVVAANVAQVDLTGITAAYDEYVIEVIDAAPVSNGSLQMRVSSDGGATFDTGSNYRSSVYQTNEGSFSANLNLGATTLFTLANGVINTAGVGAANGRVTLYSPASAVQKRTLQHFGALSTDGNFYNQIGAGRYSSNSVINAVRIFFSSGSIASGLFRLYGVAKLTPGVAGTGALVFLKEQIAAASATLDFTSVITSAYDEYELTLNGLMPATNATKLIILVSTDNGATWLSSGYRYSLRYFGDAADSGSGGNSANDSKFLLYGDFSTTAGVPGGYGTIRLHISGGHLYAYGFIVGGHTNGNRYRFDFMGTIPQTVNAIRVKLDIGNIASGWARMYGLARTAVTVPTNPLFTPPTDGAFSWVNQGTATIDVLPDSITITSPADTNNNMRMRVKNVLTAPYTATAYLECALMDKNYLAYGMCLRDGSGNIIRHTVYGGTGYMCQVAKMTSPTVFVSVYIDTIPVKRLVRWFRIVDDGTNRSFWISEDGAHWMSMYSGSRTDFLTATQIGFFCEGNNNATPNYPVIVTLRSWKETQP